MSNKYKAVGTLGNITNIRTQKMWVVVYPDADEAKFHNKNLAITAAKALLSIGNEIKVYEETMIRFKKGCNITDEIFRIDITNRIKLLMSIE